MSNLGYYNIVMYAYLSTEVCLSMYINIYLSFQNVLSYE